MMTDYLTVIQAARMLEVTEPYIRQLLKKKTLHGVKTLASNAYRGEWRINKESVIRYAATRRKSGRPRTK